MRPNLASMGNFLAEKATEVSLKQLLRAFEIPQEKSCIPGHDPMNVVVLAPHIDDETISCGGTLRNHVLKGDKVTIIFLTDGSRSVNAPEDIVNLREAEAVRAVCGKLGVEQVIFWRYRDKEL